ncbi:MAG: coenzyme F430 synthase [Candidatus Methanomethylophilaceae archaeon]|nr:coenzyme F430 synthase [Candidatus Methanomethylophilaceae archaeon]
MKVLLLDMTHGGQVLAPLFKNEGNEVTVADVYKIAPPEMLEHLREIGAEVCIGNPTPGHYDLVSMPCHCPDIFLGNVTYDDRIWYSQAVNRFMKDKRFRIEVTGVKGKTSTCYLIAHILTNAGKKVYLRSSRGSGPFTKEGHRIDELKSIAPPYLLDLPEGDYDVIVCEVSLGGSAKADITCITNLLEDYGIAKKSRHAREAKKDILSDGVNIVLDSEKDIWSAYGKPLRLSGKKVTVEKGPEFGEPLQVSVRYKGDHHISLKGNYLALQYIEAMDMALEVCDAMDIPADIVLKALSDFEGVPGRGEIRDMDGVRYIVERNPGISHMSVERTLKTLQAMNILNDALVIIDPVSKKVCDKLDRDLIEEVVRRYGAKLIVTPGDGTEPDIPDGVKTVVRMTKEGYQ